MSAILLGVAVLVGLTIIGTGQKKEEVSPVVKAACVQTETQKCEEVKK